MQNGLNDTVRPNRHLVRGLAVGAAAAITLALLPSATFADPDTPTLDEAKRQVDAANHAAEQASERYLEIAHEMKHTKKQVRALRKDVDLQQARVDSVRDQLGATIAEQLTSSPMGPTTALLSSEDPDQFLDSLSALQAYNSTQSDLLQSFEESALELGVRKDQLRSELTVIKKSRTQMAKEKSTLERKADEAEAVLDRLTPVQRAQVSGNTGTTSRDEVRPSLGSVDASGRAKAAIDFALAQLGEPYVYGAAGPSSWDCSGLTMGAYAAAGVSLPHSSSAQAGVGTAVSTSAMSPGDLVFYYSPISHVGIYLGGGQLVHAPHPGASVEITSVNSMPVSAVRRVG